jgi:hypothetical protein
VGWRWVVQSLQEVLAYPLPDAVALSGLALNGGLHPSCVQQHLAQHHRLAVIRSTCTHVAVVHEHSDNIAPCPCCPSPPVAEVVTSAVVVFVAYQLYKLVHRVIAA